MSTGNGHRTETPDVSHIRNVEVTHEPSDVHVGGVLRFLVVLTIATIEVLVMLLIDILYVYVDPRIRYGSN